MQFRATPSPPLYFPSVLTAENGDHLYGYSLIFYERVEPDFARQLGKWEGTMSHSSIGETGGLCSTSLGSVPLGDSATTRPRRSSMDPPPKAIYIPKAICIISRHSFSTFFRDWLCELYTLYASTSERTIYSYIEQLMDSIRLPRPNESIHLCIEDQILELSQRASDRLPTRGDVSFFFTSLSLALSRSLLLSLSLIFYAL